MKVPLNKLTYPPRTRFPIVTEKMKERAKKDLGVIVINSDFLLLDGASKVALAWALGYTEIEAIVLG